MHFAQFIFVFQRLLGGDVDIGQRAVLVPLCLLPEILNQHLGVALDVALAHLIHSQLIGHGLQGIGLGTNGTFGGSADTGSDEP